MEILNEWVVEAATRKRPSAKAFGRRRREAQIRASREYGGRDWDRTSDPYDVNVGPLGVTRHFTANSARSSAHKRHNSDQFTPCPVQRTRAPNEDAPSLWPRIISKIAKWIAQKAAYRAGLRDELRNKPLRQYRDPSLQIAYMCGNPRGLRARAILRPDIRP